MKIVAIVLNVLLIGFTVMVTMTDGPAVQTGYIVFSFMLVLIPTLNVIVISRSGVKGGRYSSPRAGMKIMTIVCNIVLLASVCWALIDQYPHPKEPGLLEFELLAILTPLLSMAVILLRGPKRSVPEPPHKIE